MKVGGGLYTTDKVATIKSMKGNHPVSKILINNFDHFFNTVNEIGISNAKTIK